MKLVIFLLSLALVFLNFRVHKEMRPPDGGRLVCVSDFSRHFSLGYASQYADLLWIRFLQELDAYNEDKIAEPFLCRDDITSWHYHIINLAMNLDSKFYEMISVAPLFVSVTIGDVEGASKLFDKAIKLYPNDWKILYQASYHAQVEERNLQKAADLFYRAGLNGAPKWVLSLAGGLYNELGMFDVSKSIYLYLQERFPEEEVTQRLKQKLEKKIQNFYIPKKNIHK